MGDLGSWPRAEEYGFPVGATLPLYTGRLSGGRDGHGRFYDSGARRSWRTPGEPDALLAALAGGVRRHSGGFLTDDMALLAERRPS